MKVAVGSENPVKLEAVKKAFKTVWPKRKWEVVGVKVPSGVSDQPMSDVESIKGATNRARRSLKATKAGYGVGLEGGLQKTGRKYFDCGWVVVISKKGEIGIGSSQKIEVPSKLMKLIKQGKELGDAEDIVFDQTNSKQGVGYFGLMTKNVITRADAYSGGVVVALSRFLQKKAFE